MKVAARGLSVVALTAIELTAAALVMAAIVAVSAVVRRRLPPRPSAGVLVAALLEPGVTYLLINAGIALTSGAHAAVLIGLESAFVVLLSAILTRTVPRPAVLLGLGSAVVGAVLLTEGGGGQASLAGDVLVLVGILAAAGYVVVASAVAVRMDAVTLTGYQFVVGWLVTVPLLAVLLGREGPGASRPDPASVAAAVATGVLGSVVAFLLYNWALRSVSTALAGTSLTLIPVFGLAFSVVFLGDPVSAADPGRRSRRRGRAPRHPERGADPAPDVSGARPGALERLREQAAPVASASGRRQPTLFPWLAGGPRWAGDTSSSTRPRTRRTRRSRTRAGGTEPAPGP